MPDTASAFTGFTNPDGTPQTSLQARVVLILLTAKGLSSPQSEPLSQDLIDAAFGSTEQMVETLQLNSWTYSAARGVSASDVAALTDAPMAAWRASQ